MNIKQYNNWDKEELKDQFQDVWEEIMKYCEDYTVRNKNSLASQEIFDLYLREIQKREDKIEWLMQSLEFMNDKYEWIIETLKSLINN